MTVSMTRIQAINYIRQQAPQFHVDPAAALAVAGEEGLGGGVGDKNTSFGPFQLHIGGELPARIAAQGVTAAQQWAWSPDGLNYALSRIGSVAGGLSGAAAIQAIVTRFERPQDIPGEIFRATSQYATWAQGLIPGGIQTAPGSPGEPIPGIDPQVGVPAQGTAQDGVQGTVGAGPGGGQGVHLGDVGPFAVGVPSGLVLGLLGALLLIVGALIFSSSVRDQVASSPLGRAAADAAVAEV